ncbi:hypothetical protein VTK26DRAFT_6328 [Humicola hyalothermophila]
MSTSTPSRGGGSQRPIPTPETQELYNKMRREEEKRSFEERLPRDNDQSGFLGAPSLSQGTITSPSPSHVSGTRSVTEAMNDMDVSSDQPRRRRKRARRCGPLPEVKKLKAALVRKIGACAACRERRVGCNHLDFSLFEEAYQESKQAAHRDPDLDDPGHRAGPHQMRFSHSLDLFGIGGVSNNILHSAQQGRDEAQVDFDPLPEAVQAQRPRPAFNPSSLYIFGDSAAPMVGLDLRHRNGTRSQVAQPAEPIAIGKQVISYGHRWACAWGSDGDILPGLDGGREACPCCFDSLDALQRHFQYYHAPFHEPWYLWQCTGCKFQSNYSRGPCMSCGQNTLRELWRWAKRSNSSTSTSTPMGRVASEGGPYSSTYPLAGTYPSPFAGQSGGGSFNHFTFNFGGYGNGSGGSGQSYQHKTAANTSPPPPFKKAAVRGPANTPLSTAAACGSQHQEDTSDRCRGLLRLSSYSSDGIIKFALPCAVLALTVLALLVVEAWPFLFAGDRSWSCAAAGGLSCGVDDALSGLQNVPELGVACVVAGLVASWLWRHVRFRLGETGIGRGEPAVVGEALRYERCFLRDVY